jgi:hypothetical protein
MKTTFRAPWDIKLIAMTTILIVFFGFLLYYSPGIIASVIIWSVLFTSAAFGVYGYSITQNELKVLRLGWASSIPLSSVEKIEEQPDLMLGSIRIFGIGGLFGYIGLFRNSMLGRYRAYATHTDKTVLIQTKQGEKIIVTPDRPDEFTMALLNRIEQST